MVKATREALDGTAILRNALVEWTRRSASAIPALAIAACLCIALFHGLRATRDINWHPGSDAYRDIALAQIILDGDYPADYLSAGEWLWYNPLTGAVIAVCAWLGDLPPPHANVRIAPFLNLLVPLAFTALVWRLAGGWVALVALVSFLFVLPPQRPSFVTAGYSPWLLAPHFSQALFYLTLLTWMWHLDRRDYWIAALGGLLLGMTFLGHTAPAVLLGCIMMVTAIAPSRRPQPDTRQRQWMALGIALAVAFAASLPFTISILFRYRLEIVNPAPTQWVWEGAALEKLPAKLYALPHWRSLVVLAGMYGFVYGPFTRRIKIAVLAWPAIAMGFLGYSYLAQWTARSGINLRQVTPGYHYVLYLIAAGHLFFGLGMVLLLEKILSGVHRWATGHPFTHARRAYAVAICAGVVAAMLIVGNYQSFRGWYGFSRDRTVAQKRIQQTDNFAPYHWIRGHAGSNAVFLCGDFMALFCVAPAGARAIAADPHFMNLYVPYEPRAEAREVLWKALRDGDAPVFESVASQYKLTHILAEGEQREWVAKSAITGLKEVFSSEQFTIHAWSPAPH